MEYKPTKEEVYEIIDSWLKDNIGNIADMMYEQYEMSGDNGCYWELTQNSRYLEEPFDIIITIAKVNNDKQK